MKQIKVFKLKGSGSPVYHALVDDVDYGWLNKYSWYPVTKNSIIYPMASIDGKSIRMHTLILVSPNDSLEVDHINGNGLDNQRLNLRLATKSQNLANRGLNKNNSSGYKGVSWSKVKDSWRAYITCKGVCIHLGYFSTKEAAAKAYNTAAFEYFGEFAKLNEIK